MKTVKTKLTWDLVRLIRRDYARGITQSQLSRAHKVSIGHIGRIVNELIWMEDHCPVDKLTPDKLSDFCAENLAKLEAKLAVEIPLEETEWDRKNREIGDAYKRKLGILKH